jgi:hypothetical protein
MRQILIMITALAAGLALFCLCGKNKSGGIAVVIGKDTLQLEKIRCLVPGTQSDSVKIRLAIRRCVLAEMAHPGVQHNDSVGNKCARKLTLISGFDYSPDAAALLLDASTAIMAIQRMRPKHTPKDFMVLFDSLFACAGRTLQGSPLSATFGTSERTSMESAGAGTSAGYLAVAAGVSEEMAKTILTFHLQTNGQSAGVAEFIKGLIADNTVRPARDIRAVAPAAVDSSLLALKFRPQESIRDSIAKHLANLQLIYKRQLKLNEMTSGRVWVTFRIDAGSGVTGAAIRSSEITSERFKQLLLEYVRTISFKSIPAAAGSMIVEFPFDFTAE